MVLEDEPARQDEQSRRSMLLASIEMTGTLKKSPMALRKSCSSTFPELRTSAVHELPLDWRRGRPLRPAKARRWQQDVDE
jgi:hypothetical protein